MESTGGIHRRNSRSYPQLELLEVSSEARRTSLCFKSWRFSKDSYCFLHAISLIFHFDFLPEILPDSYRHFPKIRTILSGIELFFENPAGFLNSGLCPPIGVSTEAILEISTRAPPRISQRVFDEFSPGVCPGTSSEISPVISPRHFCEPSYSFSGF